MQTRPEMHVELPDVLVELAESSQQTSSESQSSRNGPDASPSLLATPELQPATVANIDHVVVLDLIAATRPGVAGLEGLLPSSRFQWLDRLMNIVLASVALFVVTPVMLLIAIAIKLTSKGPVLYAQPRIGLDRRGVRSRSVPPDDPRSRLWAQFLALHDDHRARDLGGDVFMIYKFRSMCVN